MEVFIFYNILFNYLTATQETKCSAFNLWMMCHHPLQPHVSWDLFCPSTLNIRDVACGLNQIVSGCAVFGTSFPHPVLCGSPLPSDWKQTIFPLPRNCKMAKIFFLQCRLADRNSLYHWCWTLNNKSLFLLLVGKDITVLQAKKSYISINSLMTAV